MYEKNQRKIMASMIFSFCVLIFMIGGLAAFFPIFVGTDSEIHLEYLLLSGIIAFLIIILASKKLNEKNFCPFCNKFGIPLNAEYCPYCGRLLK